MNEGNNNFRGTELQLWYTSLPFCFPVQERLTREIAEAIMAAISPSGVGVVIEATWVCLRTWVWMFEKKEKRNLKWKDGKRVRGALCVSFRDFASSYWDVARDAVGDELTRWNLHAAEWPCKMCGLAKTFIYSGKSFSPWNKVYISCSIAINAMAMTTQCLLQAHVHDHERSGEGRQQDHDKFHDRFLQGWLQN